MNDATPKGPMKETRNELGTDPRYVDAAGDVWFGTLDGYLTPAEYHRYRLAETTREVADLNGALLNAQIRLRALVKLVERGELVTFTRD